MAEPHTFAIQPIERFAGKSSPLKRPKVRWFVVLILTHSFPPIVSCFSGQKQAFNDILLQEITCFSYDDKRKFSPDASSLQYYYPATLGADLSSGYHSFQKWDDSIDEHLDGLLRSIMELERETGQKCEADFITWRGMMTRVRHPFPKFRILASYNNPDNVVSLWKVQWVKEHLAEIDDRNSYHFHRFSMNATLFQVWPSPDADQEYIVICFFPREQCTLCVVRLIGGRCFS